MSFIFNDSIDLGDPFDMMMAFRSYASLDDGADYGELYYVPQTNEEVMEDDYVATVAAEAQDFLATYGSSLDDHEKWILTRLRSPEPTVTDISNTSDARSVRSMARRLRKR
jgi:hypothetical protein